VVKYAKGKKSVAMSDISGFKVPYKSLKTTWKGLRVEPEEYDKKHPQLRPPRNVIDATSLFKPRPSSDPDDVSFFVGYNYGDIFTDPRQRPGVGVNAVGGVGFNPGTDLLISMDAEPSGVAGTGAIGTEVPEASITETGLAGTGAIGTETFETSVSETGVAATGAVGTEVPEASITETGVAATGAVGTEVPEASITETGVAATGAIGTETFETSITEVGVAATGAIGTEVPEASITETGLAGTGAVGSVSIETSRAWGEDTWGSGTWGR